MVRIISAPKNYDISTQMADDRFGIRIDLIREISCVEMFPAVQGTAALNWSNQTKEGD